MFRIDLVVDLLEIYEGASRPHPDTPFDAATDQVLVVFNELVENFRRFRATAASQPLITHSDVDLGAI